MLDYLAIGHLTVDRLASGLTAGGSVAYSAVTAARLGLRSGILTAAGDELDWAGHLPGVEVARIPTEQSTTFENRYSGGVRTQRLLALSKPLRPALVPPAWTQPAIVHLAPVAQELEGDFPALFPGSLLALTPQGLLRSWDCSGVVSATSWAGDEALLSGCQVAVVSEDDLAADELFLETCVERVPIAVLTRGARGATIFTGGTVTSFPAFPVEEADPTGAGDVFTAAFLIEYNSTADPAHSVAFACCAASFSVERPGLLGIPDRPSVERRLVAYRRRT